MGEAPPPSAWAIPEELRARRRPARDRGDFVRPYEPGWFDRLTDWIDRMPGSNALWCVLLLVFEPVHLSAMLWINGKMAWGTIERGRVFAVVVAPYFLWARRKWLELWHSRCHKGDHDGPFA